MCLSVYMNEDILQIMMHDWTILRSKANAGVKVNAGLNTDVNFLILILLIFEGILLDI